MAKTKGYQPSKRESRRKAIITFDEEHDFHGAEIEVSLSAAMALYLDLAAIALKLKTGLGPEEMVTVYGPLIRRFADAQLISWNVLDDDGEPVAPDGDGFLGQDAEFIMAIIVAWTNEVSAPSAPLVEPSSAGKPELEASMPTVTL